MKKEKISEIFLYCILFLEFIALCYIPIYISLNIYTRYRLKRYGRTTSATVIRKDWYSKSNHYGVYFDIKFNGSYYRGAISVPKKDLNDFEIGKRYYATFLPDKIKYTNWILLPDYIGMSDIPLSPQYQDIDGEKKRIREMYHFDVP